MKAIILTMVILLTIGACQARTFGCFMGVIGTGGDKKLEVDYNHFQLFSRSVHSKPVLPFIGCGISFDF